MLTSIANYVIAASKQYITVFKWIFLGLRKCTLKQLSAWWSNRVSKKKADIGLNV